MDFSSMQIIETLYRGKIRFIHHAFSLKSVVYALAIPLTANASDDFFKIIEPTQNTSTEKTEDRRWDSKSYIQQTLKYGWQTPPIDSGLARNKSGISQARTTFFSEFKGRWNDRWSWQLSGHIDHDWYTWENHQPKWKGHDTDAQIDDAFVDVTFTNGLWIRAGSQIIAWGQSEGLTITDILSPQDLREPGQAELQDIRDSIPALFNSFPISDNTKGIVVFTYKADAHRYAEENKDFDIFASYRALGLEINDPKKKKEWEAAIKLEHSFNGGDINIIAGRVNDKSLSLSSVDFIRNEITLTQQRQTIVGFDINRVLGNWLLKAEAAYWRDVAIPTQSSFQWPLHNQTRFMSGLEFSGWNNTIASVELNYTHTEKHQSDLAMPENATGYVARVRHTAFNDRITQQWWIMKLAHEDVQIGRWDITLDWDDHWTLGIGTVIYRVDRKDSLFYPFRHNDNFNISAKFSF